MLIKQKLSKPALVKILQEYSLGKIKKIESVPTSGNITFLIKTDSKKYILRLCPEGERWRSKEEVAAELELIDYLNKNHFPVFQPVTKKNGEIVIEYKNKFGYLRTYDSGKAVLKPNIEQVQKFGQILGWFHSLIEGYQTKHKREHFWDLKTTQQNFLEVKDSILKSGFSEADDFVAKLEKELFVLFFPDELPQGMIHEDLGRRHVLWQNNKISCILDFDRCYYGKLVLDLGQALRGWCFIDDWCKWDNQKLEALINSYSQKRRLTDLEKEYLFDAVKFGVLERGLSFCLRFIKVSQKKSDQKFAHQSVSDLLDLLNQNKKEFDRILKQI
jgi:Ser/Thr protein kinase RdoA (MazF antagonist)